MMQTHLLKLDPPYKFVFDEKHGRVGKVIAVLLRPSDEEKNFDNDKTISVPIVDLACTWDDTDLAGCRVLCDEFNPRISFEEYIYCLMSVKRDKWLPNGFFPSFISVPSLTTSALMYSSQERKRKKVVMKL